MSGVLVVPLLVLMKHVNLHWLLGVSQPAALGLGKGLVEVTGTGIRRRQKLMLEDA